MAAVKSSDEPLRKGETAGDAALTGSILCLVDADVLFVWFLGELVLQNRKGGVGGLVGVVLEPS